MKIIYEGEKAKNVENFHEICLHTSTVTEWSEYLNPIRKSDISLRFWMHMYAYPPSARRFLV